MTERKFKVGDIIKCTLNDKLGTVVDLDITGWGPTPIYLIEDVNTRYRDYYSEDVLQLVTSNEDKLKTFDDISNQRVKNAWTIQCECGTKYIRDSNFHSEWCPRFKKG